MRTRDVLISIMTLAGLAAPARADTAYCNSGCSNSNSGMTYTAFDTVAATFGNAMSSPITFVGSLDGNSAYTDATTTAFLAGYNNNVQNSLQIISAHLAQTVNGSNTGIQITLPANTYAFAMMVSTVSGFGSPYVELGDRNLNAANYNLVVPSDGTPQFFGIISSTPLSTLFLGNIGGLDGKVEIQSFEVGGPAQTPEVSTLLLIGSGLVLMRFLGRRQRRPRTTPRRPLPGWRSEPDTA